MNTARTTTNVLHRNKAFLPVLAVSLCFIGCKASAVHDQNAYSSTPHDAPVEIALQSYVAGLRTIEVDIGNQRIPFLFDTAGGINLLTPAVSETIGCEPFGRLVGFRHNGEQVVTPRCGAATIQLGSWSTTVQEFGVFDLMALLGGAPEVGGIIALPLFEQQAITMDLAANRLVIETPASLHARVQHMKPLAVRASRQAGGAALDVFLAVETEQGRIWLELDSGNAGPVLLSPHAVQQLGIELSSGANQLVALNFGSLGLVNVEATGRQTIYDGVLNRAFMEKLVLTLDVRRMEAWAHVRDAG